MAKPDFITFTGVDDQMDEADQRTMRQLADRFPIEWAILYSRERGGTPRYPGWKVFEQVSDIFSRSLAVHLCGEAARQFLDGKVEAGLGYMLNDAVARVQINVAGRVAQEKGLEEAVGLAKRLHVDLVLQCRNGFPDDARVSWLFDQSGGRGKSPETWPVSLGSNRVGYAGGITPDNAADVVGLLSWFASPYWIDMETGVRTDDRFDLAKVRAVCEAVYG